MKRAFSFVLLIYLSLLSFSQNLVLNPGFESWEKLSKPAGWTTAQSCLKDSVNTISGNYSCRHDGGTKYLGQTLTVTPGKQYRLTFYYKTAITGSGNGCRIWCYWKDSGGSNLTDPETDDILRPSKYLKSDTWQQHTVDFTSPAGAFYFYLEIRTYSNSTTWLDDFDFEENISTFSPEEKESDITIYPNPANNYLTIISATGLKQICIQNLTGIIAGSFNASAGKSFTIPVSDLRDGFYIIRIRTGDKIITRKFFKRTR
jgi:hypothetical protein